MKPGILIVDDSLTVRMDLAEAFEAAGFAPTACGTAAAAQEALGRSPFALIVLDVLLPDADGIELLSAIKNAPGTARIPVMLLSTEAEVRDRVRGLTTGADEYAGKPYDTAYVIARARELVRTTGLELSDSPSRTVLVIDDSETFREELTSALESSGYTVVTAATGEEGLQLAAAVRPAAIVVDGLLPGIDGATVVRRIRLDTGLRRTPCLLLTASGHREDELQALDSGADAFVRKDQEVRVILARLMAILRSASGPPVVDVPPSLLGPKKILAVDDSPTYLEALAAQIRNEGYDLVLARSGEEALKLLGVQTVDCILLDLMMPGVSGQETCRRIKGTPAWRDIPLIMLTGLDEEEAMIEGINAGADDYITKSADFEVLKARLRAQLRRKQFEDENRRIRDELLRKEMEAAKERAARELAETRAMLVADLERKNEELEGFSHAVAHDLRAPLRAIDGFARLLLQDHASSLDTEGARLLGIVSDNVRRMARLIDDLMALSRLGRKELARAPVEMSALAQSVVEEIRRVEPERRISIVIDGLAPTVGDAGMLRQLFVNLISNAYKFTRDVPQPHVEIRCMQRGEENVYFVRDNGAGFDMQYSNKLFRVFQRLHRPEEFEGTGIGLAIVQRIVARHGGRVWAEGAVNGGATFYFTLPARRREDGWEGRGDPAGGGKVSVERTPQ